MASNNEDYDFFDDGQYNGSRRARREQQYSRGRGSGRRAIKLKVDSPASKLLRRIALITGLLAVVVAVLSAAHEIAPESIGFLVNVRGRYIAGTAAVLIGLTLILVISSRSRCRVTPRMGEWAQAASSHWFWPRLVWWWVWPWAYCSHRV